MNLGDPELELIDPTPNVHILFIQFDKIFFETKLASRAVVRWSKRMYSSAGVCSYEGRGGLCDIALSEPLLKLRPRKDLIETLLHEMIHAYLFITCRDQDRDGHGPNFKFHMHRINKSAGLNISVYHSFYDEVKLYQTHWWRCNGICQTRRPHFGIVRRPVNKEPGPTDSWFAYHKRKCGGTFIKIKEPENQGKKTQVKKPKPNQNEITKYITNNIKTINNNVPKSVLKDCNNIPVNSTKSNSANTVVITKKGPVFNPQVNKPPILFGGKGQAINGGRIRSNSVDVTETVRNIWANKQLTNTVQNKRQDPPKSVTPIRKTTGTNLTNPNKHKIQTHGDSPPTKFKKIDDYFKTTASSLLKDVYGEDFKVTQLNDSKLLTATAVNLVDCPICNIKVCDKEINRHLDECLNKEVIETLSKDNQVLSPPAVTTQNEDRKNLKEVVGILHPIPPFKGKPGNCDNSFIRENVIKPMQRIPVYSSHSIDLTNLEFLNKNIETEKIDTKKMDIPNMEFLNKNIKTEKVDTNKTQIRIRKSDNFIIPKAEPVEIIDFRFLPSHLDDAAREINAPPVKIEPSTSKEIDSQLPCQKCACCGEKYDKPIEQHLDECLAFFDNNTTIPEEGTSTHIADQTIVIDDDDDEFDETLTFNATGTKCPCPCCLQMIEATEMNRHLDICLR